MACSLVVIVPCIEEQMQDSNLVWGPWSVGPMERKWGCISMHAEITLQPIQNFVAHFLFISVLSSVFFLFFRVK